MLNMDDIKIIDLVEVYNNNKWHYEIKDFGYFEKEVDACLLHQRTIKIIKVYDINRKTMLIRYHDYVDCKTFDYIRQNYEIY